MNLYLANGTYVGTQADARAITKDFTAVEVPTDKAGLIMYLNALRSAASIAAAVRRPQADYSPAAVEQNAGYPKARDMSATAVLSRSDGPANVDEIVETICGSSGYALKRFAGAVACAFTRLGA